MAFVSIGDLGLWRKHKVLIPIESSSGYTRSHSGMGQFQCVALRLAGVLFGIGCMGTLCMDVSAPPLEADNSTEATVPTDAGIDEAAVGRDRTLASTCSTASSVWQNASFTSCNSMLSVEFDATPSSTAIDGLVGLSKGAGTTFAQFATAVRFSVQNAIDVRDGGQYRALQSVPYAANKKYHIRMVLNVPKHTYSVFVTPTGASEQTIATDFQFRTELQSVDSLDNRGIYAGSSSLQVCNFLVTATAANQAPTAAAVATPTTGDAPLRVQFDATGSSDADGTIATYAWDFGDGNVGSGAQLTHSYTSPGDYSATLTVTDNAGATGTATRGQSAFRILA